MNQPVSPDSAPAVAVSCLVLLDADGSVFATRRPAGKKLGGLWEFPGGKVEAGENPEDALRREIREELELSLGQLAALAPVEHQYPFGRIRLFPFLGRVSHRPVVQLVEHTKCCGGDIGAARALDWAPADLPVLEQLGPILGGVAQ